MTKPRNALFVTMWLGTAFSVHAEEGVYKAIVKDKRQAAAFEKRGFRVNVATPPAAAKDSDWPTYAERVTILKRAPDLAEASKAGKHDAYWTDELISRAIGDRYSLTELESLYPEIPGRKLSKIRKEALVVYGRTK